MRKTLPINLQFFADGGADNGGQDNNAGGTNNNAAGQNSQGSAGIDYDKIQEIVNTATTKKMQCLRAISSSRGYQRMKLARL